MSRGAHESPDDPGNELEQWQFEVTSAGRIWYCIDDTRRVVWMTDCSIGHPKATE